MANSAFLPFIIQIHFTDPILWNLRKIEGSFDDFRSKWNRNPKADNSLELTDYKQIFLKVRSNYSKFLKNYQNFLVNIIYYGIYSKIQCLNLVQFVHYLWQMIVKNHEQFISFHLVSKNPGNWGTFWPNSCHLSTNA